MGISALTPAKDSLTVVEFETGIRYLKDICGLADRNLAQIEAAAHVQIVRRGAGLSVGGDADGRDMAERVLNDLHKMVSSGASIDNAAVVGALRMACRQLDSESKRAVTGGMVLQMHRRFVQPRTEAQKAYVDNLGAYELCFGIGPAGTGKTYLAVAVGVTMLQNGLVEKIILSRPAVEAGERLGFLPGDMKEKVDPYMQPLYDALSDFLPAKQVLKYLEDKKIEIAPLAFMRGRTLSNAFVVLDEAQNTTSMQMKMFLTRLGEGSRMVITGDRTQIDLPRGTVSGLAEAERILKGVQGVSFNYFTSGDVVRHPLVGRIIEAYEADEVSKA